MFAKSKTVLRSAVLSLAAILGIVCANFPSLATVLDHPVASHDDIHMRGGSLPPLSSEDDAFVKSMSLQDKVGQLLMLGYAGSELKPGVGSLVARIHPGALIIFGRNIKSAKQISDLNRAAQNISMKQAHLPLLIAVDQEGGDVIRIKTHFPLPSALALGQTADPALVERAGKATGRLLKSLGFNMNLAPVLDVGDPNEIRFIGTRTYGHDPRLVGRMALHFSSGLESEGVLPTAKHFPGHGGVKEDSHLQMPVKNASIADLKQHDLVPFKTMADMFPRPWAVMLAHVVYPALDVSRMPATFSKPIVGDILRKELGFQGLVLTDDIQMEGASIAGNIGERAIRAIEAGADLIMIGWNRKVQFQVANTLYKAVKSGRLSEARIDESVRKLVSAKRLYARESAAPAPSVRDLKLALQNPEFESIAEGTLNAAMRPIAYENPDAQPLENVSQSKSIFVFSANDGFLKSFRDHLHEKKTRLFSIGATWNLNIDRIMRANPFASGVFYVTGKNAARLASRISADVAKRILVVTVEPQSSITNAQTFAHISDVYYRHPDLGRIVAQRFFNENPIATRQPSSNHSVHWTQPPVDR